MAEPLALVAATMSAVAVGAVLWLVLRPPRSLAGRVRPYLSPRLGEIGGGSRTTALGRVFGPMWDDLAAWVGRIMDRTGRELTLARLRQSGWFDAVPEREMIAIYLRMQLRAVLVGATLGLGAGHALGMGWMGRFGLLVLGVFAGATRLPGRLESAIEKRRELMRIEVYTVNQLLAMRVRAGGGVIQAVSSIVARGNGEVVAELGEALRLHRSGWPGPAAFRRIAELSPEPFCARTYRLLAAAEERGADLAGSLLALSEDVRETRRESMRRTATKRRAAMLIPTIAILAPVLILFVAAPLPFLITSWQ